MYYGNIKFNDIANGPGIRVSLFVSGCTHHCKGCFNEETWDFKYGDPFTEETEQAIIDALAPDYIKGLTILGGEPMEFVNQMALLPLLEKVRAAYPEKTIWMYSGYTYETDILGDMLRKWPVTQKILDLIDVLVDGEFKEELLDLKLRFRGSSNQRILDIKESRETKKVVLWEDKGSFYGN